MSKYSNAIAEIQESADVVVESQQPVKKPRKQRKARPYRIFNYRNVTFFLINKGDVTLICTLDKKTNRPVPAIEVPRASAIKAAQALAKLQITENFLDSINAKTAKNKTIESL